MLTDQQFPRSLLFCISQIEELVGVLRGPNGLLQLTRSVARKLRRFKAESVDVQELRVLIESVQKDIAELDAAVHETWFHH